MKALVFDVDDTLYDQLQPFADAVRQHTGLSDANQLQALYVASRRYGDLVFADSQAGIMSMEDMYVYRLRHAFLEQGMDFSDEKSLAIQHTYAENQGKIQLTAVAEEIFQLCLDKGLALGIITNGPGLHQRMKITQLGLEKWIPTEHMLISGEVGCQKPDNIIFQKMEEILQLAPDEITYVGDSFENDVVGSRQAGWHSIWLNKRNHKASDETLVEQEIADLAELLALIT